MTKARKVNQVAAPPVANTGIFATIPPNITPALASALNEAAQKVVFFWIKQG